MSDHPTVGDQPGSSSRDSANPDSNPFTIPGPLKPATPGNSHHLAPSTPAPPETTVKREVDWETVANDLPFGLIVFDAAQEVVHENQNCRTLAGFGVSEKGGIEGWLSALCPDEVHREQVLQSWQKHIWTNQVTRTFSLRVKDRKLREIEFRSTLQEEGGITVVLEDITDRVRAEENRRHSKLKFRALFAETENGTVLADRTGRIIDANPAFIELVDIPLRKLRMSTLAGLLHPRDAAELEKSTVEFQEATESTGKTSIRRDVSLRSRSGEKKVSLTYCPIGKKDGHPSMAIYVFESRGHQNARLLEGKIRTVARKAKALLDAAPDLIFLIEPDLTIADFAPPPETWRELKIEDSWRGKPIAEVWPVLGKLLHDSRKQIVDENKTIRADVEGSLQEDSVSKSYEFGVTASSAGDGQLLVVVRNQSREIAAPVSDADQNVSIDSIPSLASAVSPLKNEEGQHSFRNQLQLVTSLFSLEPQGVAARDAFLRWQIRLRALAQAVPIATDQRIGLVEMLCSLADEICSLTGAGPARRAVVVSGSPQLKSDPADASLLALLSGELMRLVLATRQQGRGPDIVFELACDEEGSLDFLIRAGDNRRFLSTDEESEIETLEILASQMRGQLQHATGSTSAEWKLVAPILKP